MSLIGDGVFKLSPAYKDYLWGGNRLKTLYSKTFSSDRVAESWECSTHPDGESFVSGGIYDSLPLSEVLNLHPEYLGEHPNRLAIKHDMLRKMYSGMPVLVKLIDAREPLSVQVHPPDEFALSSENGQMGKAEMWYVLDAAKDSFIYYGFNRDLSAEQVRIALESRRIEKYLQRIQIKKDDVFFVEPGTVHAIGAGALIAEVQENSNLIYRLYDYERRDIKGQSRTLHTEKALQVLNFKSSSDIRQPLRTLRYKKGYATEMICRCKYFEVERWLVNTDNANPGAKYNVADTSFEILLFIEGEGELRCGKNQIGVSAGECVFLAANVGELYINGKLKLLKVRC